MKNKVYEIENYIIRWVIHLPKTCFTVSIKIICAYISSLHYKYKKIRMIY